MHCICQPQRSFTQSSLRLSKVRFWLGTAETHHYWCQHVVATLSEHSHKCARIAFVDYSACACCVSADARNHALRACTQPQVVLFGKYGNICIGRGKNDVLSDAAGYRVGPGPARIGLEEFFGSQKPSARTTVLVVDEIDMLLTRDQNVLYNLFSWPHQATAHLAVIGIANTLDLPHRLLPKIVRCAILSHWCVSACAVLESLVRIQCCTHSTALAVVWEKTV
jgi:hypothetical protein